MSNNPNEDFLPFSRPSISQEAIDEVVACIKSGWITTGPRVKQFEDDLKAYCRAPHALALSSATANVPATTLVMRHASTSLSRRC